MDYTTRLLENVSEETVQQRNDNQVDEVGGHDEEYDESNK